MSLDAEIRRLRVLALAAAGEVSAKDASETLDINIGIAAYYVRDLAAKKLLYVSSETRVRGAVQTFYRITPEGEAYLQWALDLMEVSSDVVRTDARACLECGEILCEDPA